MQKSLFCKIMLRSSAVVCVLDFNNAVPFVVNCNSRYGAFMSTISLLGKEVSEGLHIGGKSSYIPYFGNKDS